MISCSRCGEKIEPDEESAYFQKKLYHPSCLGEILEERE